MSSKPWSHRLTPLVTFILGALLAVSVTGYAKSKKKASKKKPAKVAAAVTPIDQTQRRIAPSKKAAIQILAQGNNAFLGLLRMDAGGKVPKHRDATEEYIYVIEGEGTITIDGKDSKVAPGTTIFMPANAEVSFAGGAKPLVAFQVFAGPDPAAKYNTWKLMSAPERPDGTLVEPR